MGVMLSAEREYRGPTGTGFEWFVTNREAIEEMLAGYLRARTGKTDINVYWDDNRLALMACNGLAGDGAEGRGYPGDRLPLWIRFGMDGSSGPLLVVATDSRTDWVPGLVNELRRALGVKVQGEVAPIASGGTFG